MAIPFTKSAGEKRQEKVRVVLGSENFQKKKWLRVLRRFIVAHYLSITITVMTVALVYTHIYYYNRLITMEQRVGNLRADVESALQMRQNIVSGLTAVVNRFISHEQGIFSSAIETRKDSMTVSSDLKKLVDSVKEFSPNQFSPANLSRLMAVAENYPQLVSSQPYKVLVEKIGEVETQIYDKRVEYNNAVNVYNTCMCLFPVNIVSRILCFQIKPYFSWDNNPEWVFEKESQNSKFKNQN
jgi:LemA protein